MEPHGGERTHAPAPSLWPVGFAVGIAILLTGIILGWLILAIGAALTVVFGFLWVRDLTRDMRGEVPHIEPEVRRREAPRAPAAPIPAHEGPPGMPLATEEEIERFPRSRFLEATTLGVGAAIGGLITLPVAGFAVLPAFTGGEHRDIDVGSVDDFPEGEWRIVTFRENPNAGDVSLRTAYIRNNGLLDGQPSFTVLSNRCVHLGCPVQPNGPVDEDGTQFENRGRANEVIRVPVSPAGFGCPCHGGQYSSEGNPTAGPPVRALDRYEFSIRGGRLIIGEPFSVGNVEGEGAQAVMKRYDWVRPGVHVDGLSSWMYPIEPPK